MNKYVKIIIGILLVALVIAGIFYLTKGETKETTTNKIVQSQEVKDAINTIKKEAQNVINTVGNNENTDNTVSNTIAENEEEPEVSTSMPETTTTNELSNNEKAINMVKQEWGTDSSVTFKIDEQNENGKYVIGVVDKKTTKVITWYEVDIRNNTIKEKF